VKTKVQGRKEVRNRECKEGRQVNKETIFIAPKSTNKPGRLAVPEPPEAIKTRPTSDISRHNSIRRVD